MTLSLTGRALSVATLLALLPCSALAQLRGDHLAGNVGLQVGTQAPPGIYTGYALWFYPTDTLKDRNGERVGTGAIELKSALHAPVVAWVTSYVIAGGHAGGSALLPFIRNRLQANVLDVDTGLAYTDTALTPINIGWHRTRADFLAAYTLYLPSGEFEAGGSDNSGLGMLGQEVSIGGTGYFDQAKLWHAAANLAYEWHTKKKDLDLRVGQIATIEGGFGRAFHKSVGSELPLITNVGVVGYAQFKVTEDSGSDLPLLLRDLGKDRVYALGGEVNVFIPQINLTLVGRAIPEFGARLRTQGTTLSFSAVYMVKSLAKPTP
jgi:hypothetical protein